MTVRDIQHHLTTRLRVDISPDTISAITDAVLEEVMVWQQRELDEFDPVIFLDALRIKVRDGGRVMHKATLIVPSAWIWKASSTCLTIMDRQAKQGASFWASVCAELANRGRQGTSSSCGFDGLNGFEKAIEATWPNSMVQTCVVHLIRAATRWVSYSDRRRGHQAAPRNLQRLQRR